MSHSPPTHHKISKHVSPHRITQYGLIQLKCAKFKFKLEQVNYLCKQGTNNLVSHPLCTIAKCLIRSICHRVANPYRYMPSTAGVAAGSRSFFFSRGCSVQQDQEAFSASAAGSFAMLLPGGAFFFLCYWLLACGLAVLSSVLVPGSVLVI
jgi:hypothetical protein